MKTTTIRNLGGSVRIILSEEEIIRYLQSLKNCPFCGSEKLIKGEAWPHSYRVGCTVCNFCLYSSLLYDHSEVSKGADKAEDVLSPLIQKAVEEYENKLKKILTESRATQEYTIELLILHKIWKKGSIVL